MAREADFYTAEEAAKVLGISVRRVFSMLCGGELEGHQDEWARWLVPASAVQEARRSLEPLPRSGGSPGDDAEPQGAAENEARVWDAAETVVLGDGRPFLGPSAFANAPGGEESTHETDEAPASDSSDLPVLTESSDTETAERSPLDATSDATNSNAATEDTVKEIAERLAATVAKTRELRGRLERAEATEAKLRERLERERQGDDLESAQAEGHGVAAERLEKEPAVGQSDGFWRGLFGG